MTPAARSSIGAVARETGVSEDTLRYYEREGLVGPIERDAAGHRRYDESDRAWIATVTCMRDAGLGITDLRRFTALVRGEGSQQDRSAFLHERREELVRQSRALATAIAVLDDKIAYFSEHRP